MVDNQIKTNYIKLWEHWYKITSHKAARKRNTHFSKKVWRCKNCLDFERNTPRKCCLHWNYWKFQEFLMLVMKFLLYILRHLWHKTYYIKSLIYIISWYCGILRIYDGSIFVVLMNNIPSRFYILYKIKFRKSHIFLTKRPTINIKSIRISKKKTHFLRNVANITLNNSTSTKVWREVICGFIFTNLKSMSI